MNFGQNWLIPAWKTCAWADLWTALRHTLFCTRLIEQWNISPEVKSNWYDCVLADAGHTFSVHKLWSRNKELDLTDLSPSLEAVQPCQHSTKPGGRIYVLWLRSMLLRQYRTSYWISISSGTVLCNWMCARQEFSGIGGCLWLFGWFCCCCWFVFVFKMYYRQQSRRRRLFGALGFRACYGPCSLH